MSDSVQRALEAIRGKRVLLVGDLVLDAYLFGETARVSREAPVLVVRQEREEYRLGAAANVAANFAALGIDVDLLGVLGDGGGGRRVREMLTATGVDVGRLKLVDWTTPRKTRVFAGAIGTARQQVLRIDEQADGELPPSVGSDLAVELRLRANEAEIVVVSDYGLGMVTAPVIEVAQRLVASGTTVFVDSRHRLGLFTGVTVVKPNAPETAELVGFSITDERAVLRAGEKILEQLKCEACLLTQGRGGMTLVRRDASPQHVPIVGDDEVTDVTGAGDTATAAFCAGLAGGLGMPNAMRLANCAAGVVVMKSGTGTASADEILAVAGRGGVELEPWDA